MFGPKMYLLDSVANYQKALAVFNRSHKPRATPDVRPLRGTRPDNKTIRMLPDGTLALRYHETDVVVYYPNGDIDVDVRYTSRSTVEFAERLSPLMFALFKGDNVHLIHKDANGDWTRYAVNDTLHVRDNTIVGARQLLVGAINRKRMREASQPYQKALVELQTLVNMLDYTSVREYANAHAVRAYNVNNQFPEEDAQSIFWHTQLSQARMSVQRWNDADDWRKKVCSALRRQLTAYLLRYNDDLLDWAPLQPGVCPSRSQRIKSGELVRLTYTTK